MKKEILRNALSSLAVICFFGLLLAQLGRLVNLGNLEQSISDVDFTDLVFSKFRDQNDFADTNIVIINTGNVDRFRLAMELKAINKHQPKAVGLNVLFPRAKVPMIDSILADELSRTKNLVMISWVEQPNADGAFDSIASSIPAFMVAAKPGIAKILNSSDGTIRRFQPRFDINNQTKLSSFGLAVTELAAPAKADKFKRRGNDEEVINYLGNYNRFFTIDAGRVSDPEFDGRFLKDKIVLLGYMGPNLGEYSLTDNYFSPLNSFSYAGKSLPDMYGVTIHANIVSMILREDYIDNLAGWPSYIISFLILALAVLVMAWLYYNWESTYELSSKLFSFFVLNGLILLSIVSYKYLGYKLEFKALVFLLLIAPDFYEASIKFFIPQAKRLWHFSKPVRSKN